MRWRSVAFDNAGARCAFDMPDTAGARALAADDAEAQRRLSNVRFLRYQRSKPKQTPEARKAVQRAYAARRKADGWTHCRRCLRWTNSHTTATCRLPPARRT